MYPFVSRSFFPKGHCWSAGSACSGYRPASASWEGGVSDRTLPFGCDVKKYSLNPPKQKFQNHPKQKRGNLSRAANASIRPLNSEPWLRILRFGP